MQADFAVELGADDETLEMPWAAEAGGPRYYDLKRHPELLLNVVEAQDAPELRHFLLATNAPAGALERVEHPGIFADGNPERPGAAQDGNTVRLRSPGGRPVAAEDREDLSAGPVFRRLQVFGVQ